MKGEVEGHFTLHASPFLLPRADTGSHTPTSRELTVHPALPVLQWASRLCYDSSMSETLEATFDGDVFRPDGPVGLRPNTRVRLTVEPAEAPERKQESFLRVARSLELEGPSDWSSRLDEYLYGQKSGD